MKNLTIGASGFLGSYLLSSFGGEGTYCNDLDKGLIHLDIRNKSEVEITIQKLKPTVIFLPAAISNVEWCQLNEKEAYLTNVLGTMNVVDAVERHGGKLIYYSTEYVFDGRNGPYSENDTPNPINVYGQQKLEAEQYVMLKLQNALILRTTVLYGWEKKGKNFTQRFIDTLRKGNEFRVPIDQISSPTSIDDLIAQTIILIEKKCFGIYNTVGRDVMNRYEFALLICSKFGLNSKLCLGVPTYDLRQIAPRPLKAGLNTDKLQKETHYEPLTVKQGLELMNRTGSR